jgi:hypothetical protein
VPDRRGLNFIPESNDVFNAMFPRVGSSFKKSIPELANPNFSYIAHLCMMQKMFQGRVARWYFFKPKIPIWVNFGGPWNIKGWYIL